MIRFSLVATLLAVLLLPTASAQLSPTDSLTLAGLPASTTVNGTVAVLPFQITYEYNDLSCLNTPWSATVTLIVVTSSTNVTIAAKVTPTQMVFNVHGVTVATDYSSTQSGVVVVEPSRLLNTTATATVEVQAAVSDVSGGCLVSGGTTNPTATGTAQVRFRPLVQPEPPEEQAMPGPGFILVGLALVAAAIVVRRKA